MQLLTSYLSLQSLVAFEALYGRIGFQPDHNAAACSPERECTYCQIYLFLFTRLPGNVLDTVINTMREEKAAGVLEQEARPLAAPKTEEPTEEPWDPDTSDPGADNRPLDTFDMSTRSYNCLANSGIRTIGQLVREDPKELLRTPNFGKKSLIEIVAILASVGRAFGDREAEDET